MAERCGGNLTKGSARLSVGVLALVLVVGLLAGCGPAGDPPPPVASPSSGASSPAAPRWRVTVYYTPVEKFHHGDVIEVRGHPDLTSEADVALGEFPSHFVSAVREEGGGRISTGPHAGQYLKWSWDTGFWLDTSTRDTAGDPLVPFETAAVDGIERGTSLRLVDCGVDDAGSAADPAACAQLRESEWVVRDEFTPGLGGERHVDLYLGEESSPGFTESPLWVSWTGAQVHLDEPEG